MSTLPCTTESALSAITATFTEPASEKFSASDWLCAQELKMPSRMPSVPSRYLSTALKPSVCTASLNSPTVAGNSSSGEVRYGDWTIEISRVARSASSCAPLCKVACAVLISTSTTTATLAEFFALWPFVAGSVVLSALRCVASLSVALTSRSSFDLTTALPPTSVNTVWVATPSASAPPTLSFDVAPAPALPALAAYEAVSFS